MNSYYVIYLKTVNGGDQFELKKVVQGTLTLIA